MRWQFLLVICAIAFLILPVSATPSDWAFTDGCWTRTDGTDTVVKFNITGVYSWPVPSGVSTLKEVLVVGGGGSGGVFAGGGGGAGEFRNATSFAVSGNVPLSVGLGGAPKSGTGSGFKGENSTFSTIVSEGGGYGGGGTTGGNGGSGGGGSAQTGSPYTATAGGSATYAGVYGYDGSAGVTGATQGGGGGGRGAPGSPAVAGYGGYGGIGLNSSITGELKPYAAGGGGSSVDPTKIGLGGFGIGGNGGTIDPYFYQTPGLNETGSGGGGAYVSNASGAGGTGVVIIRYTTPIIYVATFSSTNVSLATNESASFGWEGVAPFTMQFTNTSNYVPTSYIWNSTRLGEVEQVTFNESVYYSPIHTFTNPGNYSISLNATNAVISNLSIQTTWVNVTESPVANFIANETEGVGNLAVLFTDLSTNATSWYWEFGDGNTSVLQNPTHTYEIPGTYNVNLMATKGGVSDWENKTAYISVYCAEFSGTPLTGDIPLVVTFTDATTGSPTAWNWSFGDGDYSNLQNPIHTYTSQGIYTVNLTSTILGIECNNSKLDYIVAGYTTAPVASFAANRTRGANPFDVLFTDTSIGSPTAWNWSFGDGDYSELQNPAHSYTTVGTFTVNLTVTNPLGSDTASYVDYITVLPEGTTVVDFSATPTSGSPGVLVQFTDLSIVTNTSSLTYNWSFGDGTYSDNIGNVQHVYSYTSVYDVNLTITNNVSAEYEFKSQYITVSTDSDYLMKYPPSAVTIHVQEFFGAPIADANVYVTGITTTLGDWDWVAQLLGYPLGEIPFNIEEMSDSTDDGGDAVFLMISSVKYNVTVVKSGYTFPPILLAPADKQYTIVANYNGTPWFETGNNTLQDVNVTVSSTVLNATHGRITVTYDDALYSTTGGLITIQTGLQNRTTIVATMPVEGNTFTNTTDVYRGDGTSYTITVSATNTITEDPYVRTFSTWFKPAPVQIPGFTPTMTLWFALFLIIFTAAFAGATQAPQMAVIICIEAWTFWAIGWLEPLTLEFVSGELGVIGMLSLATVLAVSWNLREGKRKEKGS